MRNYPNHPIFTAPLFGLPEYAAFAQKVHRVYQETQKLDSHTLLVEKAMPAVAERLRLLTAAHESERLRRLEEHHDLATKLETLKTAVEDNLFGQISFTFTPGRSRMLTLLYIGKNVIYLPLLRALLPCFLPPSRYGTRFSHGCSFFNDSSPPFWYYSSTSNLLSKC